MPSKTDTSTSWSNWLLLLLVFTLLPYQLTKLHYDLPKPLPSHDSFGRPQPSEEVVLSHVAALEGIGYRTVGTPQAKLGEEYILGQVREIEERCNRGGILRCEVWEQVGDGFHEFEILDHEVLKVYSGIRNIILRISAVDSTTENAILLGSHIDSTLPSPGAADDGIGCGVMLVTARILVDRGERFENAIIFLWNGGEETLQDGSHLYSTQHETAKSVRAVINLEAAGTKGGAVCFQATSKEMIEAYAHAPHPRGSVVASDVFSSGIIMSDTDFGQFERYLNVSGLDFAITGHSYFYHTQKDSLEHIERGGAQHFTNNIQAIVDHLLSPSSPLSSPNSWSPPDMIYVAMYDRIFLKWSMDTADKAYVGFAMVVLALAMANVRWRLWRGMAVAMLGTPIGVIAGIVAANGVAGFMDLLGKNQTWFRHEFLCLLLFVPAAYLGNFSTQLLLSRLVSPSERLHLEHHTYYAQLLFPTFYMLILQFFRARSAYISGMIASVLLVGIIASKSWTGRIGFMGGYILPLALFIALEVEAVTLTLDIFTPLTGRMGREAPSEFIIATLSAIIGITLMPPLVPLFHRLRAKNQKRILLFLASFTAVVVLVLVGLWWSPYDAMHPKRMAVQYTYNHTSGDHTAHLAFMDRGSFPGVLEAIRDRYHPSAAILDTSLLQPNSDWDVLYPVSAFLDTHKFPLPSVEFEWPKMRYEADIGIAEKGDVRDIKLKLDFTGLVWPTLAIDAEILVWSFDFPPPSGRKTHHLKIATTVDRPIVELELSVKNEGKTKIHWSAIDLNQMVPGTASVMGPDMPASKMLLDLNEWALERWEGSLDIVLYGAVVGILEI